MEVFEGASTVRLRSIHNTYLVAEEYSQGVRLDRDGSCDGARWTVEIFTYLGDQHRLRLKSFYGRYLAAHRTETAFLRLTGNKVFQEEPLCFGPRVNWMPLRDGRRVRLKCVFDKFLRANAGPPPWGNSVTVDTPSYPYTRYWILWDVEILETSAPPPVSPVHICGGASCSSSPLTTDAAAAISIVRIPILLLGSRMFSTAIYPDDAGNVDENNAWRTLTFAAGGSIATLRRRLQEETGLVNIYVCGRSPMDGSLVPLNLPPPPDRPHSQVVVVKANSTGESIILYFFHICMQYYYDIILLLFAVSVPSLISRHFFPVHPLQL
ncbi:hypothetical protein BHE74_00019934 [Ensete ventricosum]|nr:hypothetical protein BHE74_00019934 [Ensete ventricosum]